jgi:hypothetical protein
MQPTALSFVQTIHPGHAPKHAPQHARGHAPSARRATAVFAVSTGSKIWREEADSQNPKHRDFRFHRAAGGSPVEQRQDNLLHHYVYFLPLDPGFLILLSRTVPGFPVSRLLFSQAASEHTKYPLPHGGRSSSRYVWGRGTVACPKALPNPNGNAL